MTDIIRSVLVTGGTGTFGQAFARFLLEDPQIDRICIYSRGEHAQAAMRNTLAPHDPKGRLRFFIGDVRDQARLARAMAGVDSVVHAAALKRIEIGAYNPDEMVKTNVLGTMNVIEAALAAGVKRVVGLSSDKAYQPISPYGQAKALGESLLLSANHMHGWHGPRFAATRYGNIWNAQGSILPTWRAAYAAGERLILTSPSCTRFFMRIEEAVSLVWNTLETMKGGELVIPDTLPAYRLGDLGHAFLQLHPDAEFVNVGLPDWEKLHESMKLGCSSCDARHRMSIDELVQEIRNAP